MLKIEKTIDINLKIWSKQSKKKVKRVKNRLKFDKTQFYAEIHYRKSLKRCFSTFNDTTIQQISKTGKNFIQKFLNFGQNGPKMGQREKN